ncbi:MAG: protein-L-isoaspartate(D-aspartate) O-methyltransferase [Bdellovibrionales bacterium]|nr:protein-L-isoaspartate(D-aspartate) O-methyltransferase [Bdellovibrionales bacterium]
MSLHQAPFRISGLERPGVSGTVRDAMARVPRHEFVEEEVRPFAYEDRALPIGFQQTISQPYIVGLMSSAVEVGEGSKVLEIGTGSGYQAAVLSELGARVYSVEVVPELAHAAQVRLAALGYDTVKVRSGDGWQGWPEEGPFDAILVTAAAPRIPEALLGQLANRGKMILPLVRDAGAGETLLLVERDDDSFTTRELGAVKFVPLTGGSESHGLTLQELHHPRASTTQPKS